MLSSNCVLSSNVSTFRRTNWVSCETSSKQTDQAGLPVSCITLSLFFVIELDLLSFVLDSIIGLVGLKQTDEQPSRVAPLERHYRSSWASSALSVCWLELSPAISWTVPDHTRFRPGQGLGQLFLGHFKLKIHIRDHSVDCLAEGLCMISIRPFIGRLAHNREGALRDSIVSFTSMNGARKALPF